MDKLGLTKEVNNSDLQPLIAKRWSPRTFSDKEIEPEKITLMFEAARWAPSCYNEQPWTFIAGSKKSCPEVWDQVLSCLVEFNQSWAKPAPLLIITVAHLKFAKNGNDNVIAKYDLGQSAMSLVLQAQSMGLFTHQMGGFDSEKARTLFNLPENYVAVSIIAVGYLGTLDQLGEDLRKLEESPRQRKEQTEFVFTKWGTPFK